MEISISEKLYNRIKNSALRNKSRSSIIYLPDEDYHINEKMRRYKVNLDINNNLYIMKDKVQVYIEQDQEQIIYDFMITNQIAYVKDELDSEQKKLWDEILEKPNSKGLKMWIDLQLQNKTYAEKLLKNTLNVHKERCKQHLFPPSLSKHLKSCMTVLVCIIRYDIKNIKKNFETYKNDLSEGLTEAEEKSKDSKYVLYNPITKHKLKNESAYITYCEQAKNQFNIIEEMVRVSHLDPGGPPPEFW